VCNNINVTEKDPLANGIERYVGLEHIEPNSLHIKSWGNVADGTTFTKKFSAGHVLFGKRRAYLRKAAIADFDGICSGDILVFEPNEDVIDPNLFPFLVQSDRFFDFAIQTSAGSLSPRTKFQDLAKFEFLLPPKEQQAKLAELLWASDNVIEGQLGLLKSVIYTGRVFSLQHYEDKSKAKGSLNSIADINPRRQNVLNDEDEVTFLTMTDVSEDGVIINYQSRKVREVKKGFTYFIEGDTLFAKITPCMENGKGAIAYNLANRTGFGSTEFHVLRSKSKSDQLYCFFLTKMEYFRKEAEKRMVGSAGQKRVPSAFLSEFNFHIPDQEHRKWFGEKMLAFEDRKRKLEFIIKQGSQLKQQLINQIFS
ncbi:MAG: restriction endonuclease subunit S, partial [Pedobacter sp.]